ncbi:sugar phosphate isomerase/epimerase [Paenibacillus sp. GSMTC-2017]|uniref:sugar phosphate isomerase/epimerase family protein n=1 Tax=Paenibacillus sp. GSMTC-2017 TaxID=2794350 RepID=UPI0018D6A770|nr:sugar phosphate isomerase/epimerase family protein [Paenibacillus sp. GSMTC-2017]MBH5319086.1 sugar phosphate isomerase/epimerase [Paenibacillus sp. GSMTC-2017]
MKLGVSTYSLHNAYLSGEMTLPGIIDYIASIGAEHAEIVPIDVALPDNPKLIDEIRLAAKRNGIELSNYAVGGNFVGLNDADWELELNRLKREVDVCAALGITRMRHDIAVPKDFTALQDLSIRHYLSELPRFVEVCRQIADYAAKYGITTSIENHGFFVQQSDRVQAIVDAVDRSNFRTTLDVGNFLCVDEDPATAVANNIKLASMVHVKDFYYRPSYRNPGESWFNTTNGNWLRGAIAGQGDIDMPHVLGIVKKSGYDGYISIEFEGIEECKSATKMAFNYIEKLWTEL